MKYFLLITILTNSLNNSIRIKNPNKINSKNCKKNSFQIEKSKSFKNNYKILSTFTDVYTFIESKSLDIQLKNTQLIFQNKSFLSFSLTSKNVNISVSVNSQTCLFPFIFSSIFIPKVTILNNTVDLQFYSNFSDFEQNYFLQINNQKDNYQIKDTNNTYKQINILCPFYDKVFFRT